ncbi:hypothetical protein OIE13_06180 [Streptosporangium sp. NBC_01810]|uniref:hypothetical protein n=1 Tax=Streptosporangium sp. NBC_01810 TaxID=2975951 RepID=UPI002DD8BF00|nr:hypothetical protein [Streptosporangium sp. NBC_01810]WSA27462.1 hypothetical protein OIE13_06180 [Streptosporangium sp. NBC_01810]
MPEIRIPEGPIEAEPWDAIRTSPGESLTAACRTALLRELGGLEAGAWDDELLGWLANQDPSVVATVCSWLRRVRSFPPPASPASRSEPYGPQAGDELVAADGTRWRVVNLPQPEGRSRTRLLLSHQVDASDRRPRRVEEVRAQHGELTLAHRPTTPTVRGGPPLDDATEAEYRAERNDHNPEEQT